MDADTISPLLHIAVDLGWVCVTPPDYVWGWNVTIGMVGRKVFN